MAVLKYKDPETGEVLKVGSPMRDYYTQEETDEKLEEKAALTHASQHAAGGSDEITSEMIGAAPAGFGLGGDGVEVTDWNTALNNGFYRDSIGTAEKNSPFVGRWACGYVTNYATGDVVQVVFTKTNPASAGTWELYSKQRILSGGVWSDWEWVNPPMVFDTEYRTTKRLNGTPVYTRLLTLGSGVLASGSSSGTLTVDTTSWGVNTFSRIDLVNQAGANVTNYSAVTSILADRTNIKVDFNATFGATIYALVEYNKL